MTKLLVADIIVGNFLKNKETPFSNVLFHINFPKRFQ